MTTAPGSSPPEPRADGPPVEGRGRRPDDARAAASPGRSTCGPLTESRRRRLVDEQGDGEVGEDVAERRTRSSPSESRLDDLVGQEVPPAGRGGVGEDQLGLAPDLGADRGPVASSPIRAATSRGATARTCWPWWLRRKATTRSLWSPADSTAGTRRGGRGRGGRRRWFSSGPDEVELDRAVLGRGVRARGRARPRACPTARAGLIRSSRRARRVEVDRAAVVGVDHAEVPELAALVDVGRRPGRRASGASAPASGRRRPAPPGAGRGGSR